MSRVNTLPRFGITDVQIVIVSLAIGMAVLRLEPRAIESSLGLGETQQKFEAQRDYVRRINAANPSNKVPKVSRVAKWRGHFNSCVTHVLPFVTLGASIATFRHRASWSRKSLRRCGILTIAVTSFFIAVSLLNEFILRRFPILQAGYEHNFFDSLWWDLGLETSLIVAALWAVLALGGRWRSGPCGFDFLGKLVGFAWLIFLLVGHVLNGLLPFSWV